MIPVVPTVALSFDKFDVIVLRQVLARQTQPPTPRALAGKPLPTASFLLSAAKALSICGTDGWRRRDEESITYVQSIDCIGDRATLVTGIIRVRSWLRDGPRQAIT